MPKFKNSKEMAEWVKSNICDKCAKYKKKCAMTFRHRFYSPDIKNIIKNQNGEGVNQKLDRYHYLACFCLEIKEKTNKEET